MMIRIMLAFVAVLGSGQVLALDLLDIYRSARLNDARYAAAEARYRAAQERVLQARAGLHPKVDFDAVYDSGDLRVHTDSLTVKPGQRHYNAYNDGISVTPPLQRLQGEWQARRGSTW